MRAFQELPIKRQLMLLIMLTSGVVLLLACAAFVAYDQYVFRQNMKRDLTTLAKVIGGNSRGALVYNRPENAQKSLATLQDVPNILAACVYDTNNTVFAKYPEQAQPPARPAVSGQPFFGPNHLNVFEDVVGSDEERLGTIFLQSSLRDLHTRLQLFTGGVAVIMFAAFAVVFILSSRFQGLISEPILDLAQTARAVSERQDYSLRVHGHTAGEIGVLINQFNSMLAKVEAGEQAMRQVNRQLMESEQRALAATQAKSQFLANMSHELRTPLNAIIGFSEILYDKTFGELNDRQLKYARNILTSGRHLLQLINDILDLAKIEAGKLELERTSFDPATALEDVQTIVKALAHKKGITLSIEADPQLPPLFADQPKFKQIMYNLLSNAIKFTPDAGRVTVTAQLSAWEHEAASASTPKDGPCLRVCVADTGIGIQPKDQERVFLEFEQADSSYARQQHGTGLGLSLTRKLVELHRGRIWVESEGIEGKGSRFTFLLPIHAEERAGKEVAELPREPAAAEAGPDNRPLVLVVEDERQAGELLEEYLKSGGYAVAHAWDGEKAVPLVRQLRPAAITLDILLPKKSGWDVLAELKTLPETRDIPVIIVSVSDDLQLGFSLGAVEYFVKPVSKERLLEVIRKACAVAGRDVRTVLVVDDDRLTVEYLTGIIRGEGYEVVSAYGGREGMDLAVQRRPDLIILDLIMPEVSGFQVVQQLRATPETREIPILIYTAKDLTDSERQALIRHVQAIASKSGKEDLLRELRRLARPDRFKNEGLARGALQP